VTFNQNHQSRRLLKALHLQRKFKPQLIFFVARQPLRHLWECREPLGSRRSDSAIDFLSARLRDSRPIARVCSCGQDQDVAPFVERYEI
jgi:hypothetical protein